MRKARLSSDTLQTLQIVVETAIAQLEKLHYAVVPFIPTDTHKGANAHDTLRNIAKQRVKLQKAITEVCEVFEGQFSLKQHAKTSGMSLYAYKKRLNEYRKENPLGNSRPYFVKLTADKNKVSSRVGRKGKGNLGRAEHISAD